MGEFNAYEAMRSMADAFIKTQEIHEGDFYDPFTGLLMCGKCGKPRQSRIPMMTPTPEDPKKRSILLVTTMCDCEQAEYEKEKKREMAEKDMELIRRLQDASLIDSRCNDAVFEQYQITSQNETCYKVCKKYADDFTKMLENNQGLLLWGDVGTGKSFAAACIANQLLSNKTPVVMTSFVKLLEMISSNEETESSVIRRINRAKLVIFDDLGAERGTGYSLEKVYDIIDSRYRRKKPMILTTNLTVDEMKRETDPRYSRIYDRVFECCYPVHFTGNSWRKKEASRRYKEMQRLLGE